MTSLCIKFWKRKIKHEKEKDVNIRKTHFPGSKSTEISSVEYLSIN